MGLFDDINKVTLLGNITSEPEVKVTPSGTHVLELGLATNRRYRKDDEWVDETTFHNLVIWGNQAESVGKWVKKGTRVHVVGRIQTRSWDNKEGKRSYRTEINVEDLILLDRFKSKEEANETKASQPQDFVGESAIDPDDLPF